MMVHGYRVGRYSAIIRKRYEDGTVEYETDFSSDVDLIESVNALIACIGQMCGMATDHPAVLKTLEVIQGKERIEMELKIASMMQPAEEE